MLSMITNSRVAPLLVLLPALGLSSAGIERSIDMHADYVVPEEQERQERWGRRVRVAGSALDLDHPDIERFIEQHRGLDDSDVLAEADFWNPAQAAFLREALEEDADWAEVVDQLDAMLRR